jgi:DNA-binding CsgD family transcriptional regulator
MIGRSAEVDRLVQLAEHGPAPAIALIGGEAGVGKTRLVRELIGRLPAGTEVLAGQADPGSLGRPFELFLDALGHARDEPDERLEVVVDPERDIDERVRAGFTLLASVSSRAPSVVVFDDLHWADSESLLLFERLAEPGSGPRLLIGTYRPDALTRRHPAASLLPRLERRHAVADIHLDRLSISEVAQFLHAVHGREPSFRVADEVHGRTGGNPFFLEELLAAAGQSDPEELLRQPIPWSLGELVRSQLEGLSPEERSTLEVAAVLGRRVGFDLLATVSGFSEAALIRILRTLVERNLLLEAEADVFSFRHALAREAIESDLLGRERRRLHEAALAALQAAESTDHAALAHHARGAGRYDEMVDSARAGARAALAAGAVLRALALAELGLSEAEDDPELLAIASRSAWLAGLGHDAMGHAQRRLRVARRSSDAVAEASTLRLLARLSWEHGDQQHTAELMSQLEALLDRLGPTEEGAKAMATLAQMHMLGEDAAGTLHWADRAAALADRVGAPEVRVRAEVEKGTALAVLVPARADEGLAMLRRVADEATAQGQWVLVARAMYNLMGYELARPDPVTTRAGLSRMRDAAERAGFASLATDAYWNGLAELAEWEGDFEATLGYLAEAEVSRVRRVAGHQVATGLVHLAGLMLEVGDVSRAEALVASVDPMAGAGYSWWHGMRVHVACLRHDAATALREAEGLTRVPTHIGIEPQLASDLVRALLRAGAPPAEVAAVASRFRLMSELDRGDGPWRALLDAHLAAAAERPAEAAHRYRHAIAGGQTFRPHVLGSAHVGLAACLLAAGSRDEAADHLNQAHELLARWAGERVDELHAVEARLGGTVRSTGSAGSTDLTPREREVAALLAEGLTNGELATRLYISPKTASVHVSNILAKLGMTSRAEIAAYAVRSGLAPS